MKMFFIKMSTPISLMSLLFAGDIEGITGAKNILAVLISLLVIAAGCQMLNPATCPKTHLHKWQKQAIGLLQVILCASLAWLGHFFMLSGYVFALIVFSVPIERK